MMMWFRSLALVSGLRIWNCHKLQGRSQMRLRFGVAMAMVTIETVAMIWPLAWELPYVAGATQKKEKIYIYIYTPKKLLLGDKEVLTLIIFQENLNTEVVWEKAFVHLAFSLRGTLFYLGPLACCLTCSLVPENLKTIYLSCCRGGKQSFPSTLLGPRLSSAPKDRLTRPKPTNLLNISFMWHGNLGNLHEESKTWRHC